jgi:DNA-nicking Smr family endonuclease
MPLRARGLSQADREAWAAYARMIVPLIPASVGGAADEAIAPPKVQPNSGEPPRPLSPDQARASRTRALPLSVDGHPGGLDSATWQRLRSGKLSTERRLDLHGLTVQRAFHALVPFLRSAHADRLRCVEIITGRGTGESGGAIRREFPHWLNLPEIRPLVLGAVHPHPLNPGSVRVLLRRVR